MDVSLRSQLRHGLEAMHRNWAWYLALGIGLIVLGTLMLGAPLIATLTAVVSTAMLLIIAGAAEAVGAFWTRRWTGFFLHLLSGVLYIVLGILFLRRPIAGAEVLTLLIASFLMVSGLFRLIASLYYRFPNWVWAALSGLVSLALALYVIGTWPASAVVLPGTLLGIDLLFHGWFWVMLGLSVKKLPDLGGSRAGTPAAPAA